MGIIDGINALIAKINQALAWFKDLFVGVFTALADLVKDMACWVFDQILGVVISAVNALDLTGITSGISSAGTLPSELLNVLGLLGVHQAIGIIGAAILIRLLLQLIPFVRLGS